MMNIMYETKRMCLVIPNIVHVVEPTGLTWSTNVTPFITHYQLERYFTPGWLGNIMFVFG